MVVHRGVRVADGHIFISAVPCQLRCEEQKVQVHHIVDYDREIPGAEVPRPDTAGFRAEPSDKIVRGLDYHVLYGVGRGQPEGIAVAAPYHKAQVVCPVIVSYRIEKVGVSYRIRLELLVPRELVCIPQGAREEAAGPVVYAAEPARAFLLGRRAGPQGVLESRGVLVQLPAEFLHVVSFMDGTGQHSGPVDLLCSGFQLYGRGADGAVAP